VENSNTNATFGMVLCFGVYSILSASPGPRVYPRGFKRVSSPADEAVPLIANITEADIIAAPDAIDWTAKGATTAVKDQGQCGSCWAFSTTEGVESAVFRLTGKLPAPLSTEELVSCDKIDGGCDGGDLPTAVRYLKKHGMASASDYPDRSSKSGRTGHCTWNDQRVARVSGMSYAVPQCKHGHCAADERKLAAAVAKFGPLSICVNSGDGQPGDWAKYKSGVWDKECEPKASFMDHCVQLVGYNKSGNEPYWKVRNSWGTDWGESGFIRLPYGKNACCIGCEVAIIDARMTDENAAEGAAVQAT